MLPRTLLKGKNFKDKLYSEKYLSGVWSTLGSENIAHIMANSGLDYILIDLEHGLGGFETISKQVLSILSLETAVMVRLPDHSEISIKRILDAGANAILVPQVNNIDQAQEIINYSLFAPEGRRGVAVGQIPASDFGYKPEEYFANANKCLSIFMQIETLEGVKNLDEIIKMKIDGIFVGPNDLSASMNLFRQYDNPDFIKTFNEIRYKTLNSGKLFGSLPFDGQDLKTLLESGASLVPNGSDHMFLKNSSQALIKKFLDMS
jgi:4-hydroxy-2-oxoheptanedioate aldolase